MRGEEVKRGRGEEVGVREVCEVKEVGVRGEEVGVREVCEVKR